MKKFAMSLVSAAVLTSGFTATTATVEAADRVLLKTPIAFGSHLPALGTPIKWVSEQLPTMSDGSMK